MITTKSDRGHSHSDFLRNEGVIPERSSMFAAMQDRHDASSHKHDASDRRRPTSRFQIDAPAVMNAAVKGLIFGLIFLAALRVYKPITRPQRTDTERVLNSGASTTSVAFASRSVEMRLRTVNIEDVQVGTRLAGRNPIHEQVERIEPDQATWRTISLCMNKTSGNPLWMDFIRPLDWIERHGVKVGGMIDLNLPEFGAVGSAKVISLGACPPIPTGDGAVVTGKFKHQSDENNRVVQVNLEDQPVPIGVTGNHRFWSVDRRAFIAVRELRPGDIVDTAIGHKRVESIAEIQYDGFLYNIETTEHVYRVGSLGTLVHNDCEDYAYQVLRDKPDGTVVRMEPIPPPNFPNPQTGPLPGYPVPADQGGMDTGAVSGAFHYFHLEDGTLTDPAHPNGIPIGEWLQQYSENIGVPVEDLPDVVRFIPSIRPGVH